MRKPASNINEIILLIISSKLKLKLKNRKNIGGDYGLKERKLKVRS